MGTQKLWFGGSLEIQFVVPFVQGVLATRGLLGEKEIRELQNRELQVTFYYYNLEMGEIIF